MDEARLPAERSFNIQLAVDGSEHSLAAARFVRDLSLISGSEITILGVIHPYRTPGRAELLSATEQVLEILEDSQGLLKSGLLHGEPANALVEFANEHRPDLLVVGAKGLHARFGVLLGGVAQEVVEQAGWSVLVVRAPYTGLQNILLAVDGSIHSRKAGEYIARMPLPKEVKVNVIHVISPDRAPVSSSSPQSAPEVDEAASHSPEKEEELGEAILADVLDNLKSAGIDAKGILARGEPAETMLKYADDKQIDLIASGSRGLSTMAGWLLGSVSRRLIHSANCSVLIVRDRSGLES